MVERNEERRQRFLDAALEVFYLQGYQTTTVVDICRQAGLSTRQFYDTYGDRESILSALYDQANDTAQSAVMSSLASEHGAIVDRLHAALRAYAEVLTRDPRVTHLVVTSVVGVSDEFERRRDRQRQQWIASLNSVAQVAIDNGELPDRDYTLTWVALVGSVNSLAAAAMGSSHATYSLEELLNHLDRMLRSGLLSP